jgi:hypothetical protein
MNNLKEKRSAMTAMIEDWQSSGKSKKQYCLENGINEAKFYYWYSRTNEKDDAPRRFIPIDRPSGVGEIELSYPNGVKLKFNGDLPLLARLIRLY